MPPPLLRFWLPLLLLCLYAWRKGGTCERAAALIFAGGAALSHLLAAPTAAARFATFDAALIAVDCAVLVALVVLAFKAHRPWPIPIASLQVLTVLGHLGAALNPSVWTLGYAIMAIAPVYPMMLILAGAIHARQRRLRRDAAAGRWPES